MLGLIASPYFVDRLGEIINKSLNSGTFPDKLNVRMLHQSLKKGTGKMFLNIAQH